MNLLRRMFAMPKRPPPLIVGSVPELGMRLHDARTLPLVERNEFWNRGLAWANTLRDRGLRLQARSLLVFSAVEAGALILQDYAIANLWPGTASESASPEHQLERARGFCMEGIHSVLYYDMKRRDVKYEDVFEILLATPNLPFVVDRACQRRVAVFEKTIRRRRGASDA